MASPAASLAEYQRSGSCCPAQRSSMQPSFIRPRLSTLTLAWSAFFVSSISCGPERPADPGGSVSELPLSPDSIAGIDSLAGGGDSLPGVPDSLLPGDSLIPDSVANSDSTPPTPPPSYSGVPFGPVDLFQSWYEPAASGFAGTLTYASPWGIIPLLNTMRAHGVRGFLKMTGESHETYKTNDRFDFEKWKQATSRYDTPEIRAAVATAVAEGTLLGYSMLDEASRFSWNGSLDKAMIDRMAAYSKSIFPTLPTGVVVPYGWRPDERYQVLDVLISQTWKPTKTPAQYRDEAVAAARLNGVALAIAVNILAGPQKTKCEKRPRGSTCMMTPDDIRKWAVTMGSDPYICAVFMWRYDKAVWEMPKYVTAFKDASAQLADGPPPNCRRRG